MSDLPFLAPDEDPTRPTREPRKCRRHDWTLNHTFYGNETDIDIHRCTRCGEVRDETTVKRNRNNKKRGTSDEAKVAAILGGRKVGPMGWPWDVEVGSWMRAQCKQLDRWPSLNQVVAWLDAIPAGDYMRAVTLADTPGAGRKTRRLIVIDLDEFVLHHGRA